MEFMKNIAATLLLGLLGMATYSQPNFKESVKNYDDVCFCSVGLAHPANILGMDNNMEILFALKTPKTLHELTVLGIDYTKSQISLLKLSGLIEKKDSLYHATVPILSEEETIGLRSETKRIARAIIPQFIDDYGQLINFLDAKQLQQNSYSLFFAFVLDGLVWDILEQNKDIEETAITTEKPFWDGVYWMVTPKRRFSCGTNSISSGNLSISVNWSDVSPISVSSYKMLGALLDDYSENGRVTKPAVFKTFEQNGLFGSDGKLLIPVIKADSTDAIYCQSKIIAAKVVKYLISNVDYSAILSNYSWLTKGQKITILYHEIMWDMLDAMEEKGVLEKPVAFSNPSAATPTNLRDLIFIVQY